MIDWDHKAWIVCERIIGLISLLVLAFAVWNSLLRVEANQAKQSKDIDRIETLIKSQMKDPEQWKTANDLMKKAD